MTLEDRAAPLCGRLPAGPAGLVRRWGAALLTPLLFTLRSGHWRSAVLGRPVNRRGAPVPWYTYPAIDFLSHQSLSGRRVLEFGAGHSTLWWAARAKRVVAFEDSPEWFRRLQRDLPANVELHFVSKWLEGIEALLPAEPFDVIAIDGLDRFLSARLSLRLMAPDGAILLDDSEGGWGEQGYPILDLFRGQGFQRIDFHGYAPGVIRPHCTSVFFRGDCFLLSGKHPPGRETEGVL
jgi:hypothetical protein